MYDIQEADKSRKKVFRAVTLSRKVQRGRLGCDLSNENFCVRQDNQSSISSKDHVRGRRSNEELSKQCSLIVPYVDTVAASSVDISLRINLDTVWNARVYICEYAAVGECLCSWVDIETESVKKESDEMRC